MGLKRKGTYALLGLARESFYFRSRCSRHSPLAEPLAVLCKAAARNSNNNTTGTRTLTRDHSTAGWAIFFHIPAARYIDSCRRCHFPGTSYIFIGLALSPRSLRLPSPLRAALPLPVRASKRFPPRNALPLSLSYIRSLGLPAPRLFSIRLSCSHVVLRWARVAANRLVVVVCALTWTGETSRTLGEFS